MSPPPPDIDDLLAENTRLREALRRAEPLAALGRLLSNVAHELSNPLAIVLGRAELLAEDPTAPPAVQAHAGRIRDAASRCGRLLRSCQDLGRTPAPQCRPVRLAELVHATLDLVAPTLRRQGVALSLALDEALPPLALDADQVARALLHLLANGQQALQDHPAPQLTLSCGADPDGQPWLRVQDNGPGVPAAVGDRVFDEFFSAWPGAPGTGLGLTLAREVARAHGGDLRLEPTDDGASFVLQLPASCVVAPAGAPGLAAG